MPARRNDSRWWIRSAAIRNDERLLHLCLKRLRAVGSILNEERQATDLGLSREHGRRQGVARADDDEDDNNGDHEEDEGDKERSRPGDAAATSVRCAP